MIRISSSTGRGRIALGGNGATGTDTGTAAYRIGAMNGDSLLRMWIGIEGDYMTLLRTYGFAVILGIA